MGQNTKDLLNWVFKGAAVLGFTISSFFLAKFVNNSEDTRDSMIRLEIMVNDMIDQNSKDAHRIEKEIDELKSDIKNLYQKP